MPKEPQYRSDVLADPQPSSTAPAAPGPGRAALPEGETEGSAIDFLPVARTVRTHRRFILLSGLVVFLLALSLALYMRPRYTSEGTFIPAGGNSSGSSALAGQLAAFSGLPGLSSFGGRNGGDLDVALLRSGTVLGHMVQRFDLVRVYKVKSGSIAAAQLAGHSHFSLNTHDPIVSISVTDHDPRRAQDMVNGYLDELQKLNDTLALSENSQRRLFFEQQLQKEKDLLADAEVALKQNQESTGVIAPGGQAAGELQAIAGLRADIAARRVQLAALLHDETEQNTDVLRVRSEIDSLSAQVSQMENGPHGGPSGGISTAQAPGLELNFVRLSREVKYHENLYEIMSRQYEAARLDEAHDTPLQRVDVAFLPDSPSGPPRVLISLGGLLFGLFAGTLWIVFRERTLRPYLQKARSRSSAM